MALTVGYDASGLDGKLRNVIDTIVAAIQTWAGGVDGINAAERLNELTTGLASLPTFDSGDIVATGRSTARSGFVMCDGTAYSRTSYANLFAAISTAYGAGDGSTTFNVPNLQQRFPLGKAASGTGSTLGSTGGAINHTHTGPSHTHTITGATASDGSHTHTVSGNTATTNLAHTHGFPISEATGTPSATTDVQSGTGATVASSTHTHLLDSAATATALTDHSHSAGTLTAASDGAHTHAVGTLATSAGGTAATGTADPPFQVVNYMIKT